jgi:hypothetical protein
MRLIDADALLAELDEPLAVTSQPMLDKCARWARDIAKSAIKKAPIVDAVPVIHRCWTARTDEDGNTWLQCSECEYDVKWISVDERLPEDGVKVLCCTKTKSGNRNIVIGYHDGRWCCGMNSNVTHWMPLPEVAQLDAPPHSPAQEVRG